MAPIHGPSGPSVDDHPEIAARNARIGLILFAIYVLFYAGFVLCAVTGLLATPIGATNLAVWYGFGLILAAFALAMLYGAMCRSTKTTATKASIRPDSDESTNPAKRSSASGSTDDEEAAS